MSHDDPKAAERTKTKYRSKEEKAERKATKRKRNTAAYETTAQTSPVQQSKRPKLSATSDDQSQTQGPQSSDQSPFHLITSSLYLPLSPIALRQPLEGICAEHLSPLILTYCSPFRGVILSYCNVRLSEELHREDPEPHSQILAQSINEYAVSFIWVTADFTIFRPQKDGLVQGWINLQNEGHIGLVCWNLFNASIERRRLPSEWKWIAVGSGSTQTRTKPKEVPNRQSTVIANSENVIEGDAVHTRAEAQGYFEDENGHKVEGELMFRVKSFKTSRGSDREKGFMSIDGTLLSRDQELRLTADDLEHRRRNLSRG
ncbi:hypothetical protein MMC25_003118 [Agyrium rufum]|nr:hypothetical protein [Agyrium rufum]